MENQSYKETEIGKIPEDWEVKKAQDCIESIIDYRGKTPKKTVTGIPLITAKVIKGGHIDFSQCEYIADEDYDDWMIRGLPKKGDVVLTTEGPLGEVAQLDDRKIALAQRIVTLRGKRGVLNNNYLKYYLISSRGQHELHSRETGTTVQGIKQSEFKKINIILPSFSEQTAIAKILSDLDSKIEFLQKQNKTLEAIGQAIFKHWFVDFEFPDEEGKPYKSSGGEMVFNGELGKGIPKWWGVGTLGDICEITMGQSPPGKTYNEILKGTPFYQGNRDFGFRFPTRRVYCTAPTRFAEEGNVLLSVRAPVGNLNVAEERCAIGRGVAALRLNGKQHGYLYYLLRATQSGWNEFEAEGTVFGSANKSDVHEFKVVIPPNKSKEQFASLIKSLDDQIINNEKQSRALTSIRDTLLPKLMSGEIGIKVGNAMENEHEN